MGVISTAAVKSPVIAYLTGLAILIAGVLLVVSHSVWTYNWQLVITLIGWAILLKGTGRIFFPNAVVHLVEKNDITVGSSIFFTTVLSYIKAKIVYN